MEGPTVSSDVCSITVKVIITDDSGQNIMTVFEKEQFKNRGGKSFPKNAGCGLPGGGVRTDKGEDVLAGARRELLEELGGKADMDTNPEHWIELETSPTHKIIFIRATNFEKIQESNDHDIVGFRWLSWRFFNGLVAFGDKMYPVYGRHADMVLKIFCPEDQK